ncbi:hypothetical protein NCC78_20060 [Micromonospora phytophila]|uniref:hypothetical protein n=1 Tax=Micromonospora phytophila TaxID=709888 RepID=UPI0020303DC7|nr:hypothetical protein [Micromonospora phytophila]MCM0676963.1 hypothetical protein [Micromonospora phytophila]
MHNQPGGLPPVFVDRTGRRRRFTVIAGTAMGLGLLTSLGLIAAGLFMDSTVPLPGWSDTRPAAPLEAGVDGRDELGGASPVGPRPSPLTSTSVPVPTRTAGPGNGVTATGGAAAQPASSEVPGQGDERRSAKPTRSSGKPR